MRHGATGPLPDLHDTTGSQDKGGHHFQGPTKTGSMIPRQIFERFDFCFTKHHEED